MMEYNNPNDFWRPGEPDIYKDCSDEERTVKTICHTVWLVVALLIALGICAMCSSCTTTQYIPVIEHHTDTLIVSKVEKDSIYVHDSTIVEKGDSIIKIEHWHTKYVDHEVHDTIYQSKTDSIPVPYEVKTTVEVERPLHWWEKGLMWTGGIALLVLGIGLWWKLR